MPNAYINQAIRNQPKPALGLAVGMRIQTKLGLAYVSSMGYARNGLMLNTDTMCINATLINNPNVTFQISYNTIVFTNGLGSELSIPNQINNNL